jgi:transposase
MSQIRNKYDEEFKKNAVKLSYTSSKTVKDVAESLGIHETLLYTWRKKYTSQGDKTRYASLEEELRDTNRKLAEVTMERDMLKKAAAYFASQQK